MKQLANLAIYFFTKEWYEPKIRKPVTLWESPAALHSTQSAMGLLHTVTATYLIITSETSRCVPKLCFDITLYWKEHQKLIGASRTKRTNREPCSLRYDTFFFKWRTKFKKFGSPPPSYESPVALHSTQSAMSLLHTITTAYLITACDLPGTWGDIV